MMMPAVHKRTRAREAALQALYLADLLAPGASEPLRTLAGNESENKKENKNKNENEDDGFDSRQAAEKLLRRIERLAQDGKDGDQENDPAGESHGNALPQAAKRNQMNDQARRYACSLVVGVLAERRELDRLIADAAENWRLGRMAIVDRNILRLGAWELAYNPDIPEKVAIDEAIELAKRFGSKESGAFVNGILDRVRKAKQT